MMAVANFDMEFPDSSDAEEGHGDYLESAEPPPAKKSPVCVQVYGGYQGADRPTDPQQHKED